MASSICPLGTEPVSPDGKLVASRADGKVYLYDAGAEDVPPRPIPGLAAGEAPLRWSADGKELFVAGDRGAALTVHRFDLSTGRKRLWKEFAAVDPAGVLGAPKALINPGGESWVYAYWRDLSDLYLVDGLR